MPARKQPLQKPKPAPKKKAVKAIEKVEVLPIIEKVELLESLGWDYILECVSNTKEVVSASGCVVEVLDRRIPTIDYFLRVWIPMKILKQVIHRRTWYKWLDDTDSQKGHTIKDLDDNMKALALDIVANEGRGIFYAKNRLGMHDRQQIETKNVDRFDFDN
jgi:hypothetical protein